MKPVLGMYILHIHYEHTGFWFPLFCLFSEFIKTLKLLHFIRYNLPGAFCFIEDTLRRRDFKV